MSKAQETDAETVVNRNLEYTETLYRHFAREQYWAGRNKREYDCPDCGRGWDRVHDFHVHHKDRDPSNNHPENLVALCHRCHMWRHHTGPTIKGLDLEEWKGEFAGLGSEPSEDSINNIFVYDRAEMTE